VATSRPARRRLALGTAAIVLAAVLATAAALAGERSAGPLLAGGALACTLLMLSVARRSTLLVGYAVAILGAGYAAGPLLDRDAPHVPAPAYGVGLLLVAELALWSFERSPPSVGGDRRRAATLASLAVGALVLGTLLVGVAQVDAGGGLVLGLLGLAAAAGVLLLAARLAR